MPVVDVHAHAMPMSAVRYLEKLGLADLAAVPQGVLELDPDVCGLQPNAPIPFPAEQYEIDRRLPAMDKAGIDIEVISPPPFLFAAGCDDDALATSIVAATNDAIAEFVAAGGERFRGLGGVALGRPGAVAEAARCLDELGLDGVTIGTSGAGKELDAPEHGDLWALLAERSCPILLHPNGHYDSARLASYHLTQLLGYPTETALAVARLIFGGILDRFDLTLVLAHGGGCIRSVRGRLDLGWRRKTVANTSARLPSSYLGELYYDTAVFDPVILRRMVEDVGYGRVLLGTDAPFDLADRSAVEMVESLGLSAEEEQGILGQNALRLIEGDPR